MFVHIRVQRLPPNVETFAFMASRFMYAVQERLTMAAE
jgi:hypothetical protein